MPHPRSTGFMDAMISFTSFTPLRRASVSLWTRSRTRFIALGDGHRCMKCRCGALWMLRRFRIVQPRKVKPSFPRLRSTMRVFSGCSFNPQRSMISPAAPVRFPRLRLATTHHHKVVAIPHQEPQVLALPLPRAVEFVQVDVGKKRRDHATLGCPRQRLPHRPVLHHPGHKPLADKCKHPPVRDPLRHHHQSLFPVDGVEIASDVRVDHEVVAPVARLADSLQGLRRVPLRAEAVTYRQKIRLEDRLDDHFCRPLSHAVPNRGYPKRPLLPVCLRNVPPPHRARAVPACQKVGADALEERFNTLLLDGPDALFIHAGCPFVAAHPPPRFPQDVTPADPVEQRVETPCPAPLGTHVKLALEFSHFAFGVVGPYGHALALTPTASGTEAGSLPSSGFSPPSPVLRTPRTPS